MITPDDARGLLHAPLAELVAAAGQLRDEHHGNRVTYSPKVFIPLTMLCRDRCGYCTFAKPPARLDHAVPADRGSALDRPRRRCARAATKRCSPSAKAPRTATPSPRSGSPRTATPSTVDYLEAACRAVLDETGLLPHANAGALTQAELERLRTVSPSQGMMLESLADRLHEPGGPHYGAPDKTAARRLATLEAAGRARIPFTTGILVGFGETIEERLDALLAIRDSHDRHGHVQEVIVQNFLPKPGTKMHDAPPCPPEELTPHHRSRPPGARRRDAHPGAAEPHRRRKVSASSSMRASTTGVACRRSPRTT